MEPMTKKEIERIRHVNELKRMQNSSPGEFKLMYAAGANLVLLWKDDDGKWLIEDETGPWNDVGVDYWEETEQ